MKLEPWIQPQHLAPAVMPGPSRLPVIVDELLQPDKLTALQAFFRHHGRWQEQFGLFDRDPHEVDEAAWMAAPEPSRFYRYRHYAGVAPTDGLAVPVLTHLKILQLLESPAFTAFVAGPFGQRGLQLHSINARIMAPHHFLRPHSDRKAESRSLCGILYVHPDWHEGFGTELVFGDGRATRRVAPVPNRLVLFDPRTGLSHHVAPRGPAARDWERWNLAFWYGPAGA
jgi:hypothetical protein